MESLTASALGIVGHAGLATVEVVAKGDLVPGSVRCGRVPDCDSHGGGSEAEEGCNDRELHFDGGIWFGCEGESEEAFGAEDVIEDDE